MDSPGSNLVGEKHWSFLQNPASCESMVETQANNCLLGKYAAADWPIDGGQNVLLILQIRAVYGSDYFSGSYSLIKILAVK